MDTDASHYPLPPPELNTSQAMSPSTRRYTREEKMAVVRDYQENGGNFQELSERHHVSNGTPQRWIRNFEATGDPDGKPGRKSVGPGKGNYPRKPKNPPSGSAVATPPQPAPERRPDNAIMIGKFNDMQDTIDRLREERDALKVTLKMVMSGDW